MTGMPSLLAVTLHSLPLRRIVSPISGGGCALEASISKVPSGKRISKLRPGMSAGCPPAATPNLGRRLGYTSPSRTGPSWSATSTPRSSARPVADHRALARSPLDRRSTEQRELARRQADEERIACVLEAGRVQERSQGGNVLFADGNTGEPHAPTLPGAVECQTEAVSPGSRRSSSSPPPGRGVGSFATRPGQRGFRSRANPKPNGATRERARGRRP